MADETLAANPPRPAAVVVSGSRSLTDAGPVIAAFERLVARADADCFDRSMLWLHGGAAGVDEIVHDWLTDGGEDVAVERPDYDRHGRRAPLIRNRVMVRRAADTDGALLAIWDGRSTGTAHAIRCAADARLPVFVEVVQP